MTLPNLISFSGYANAGKDAAADVMVSRARFVKTYMAKPLEQALVQINPWIVDHKENALERFEALYTNLGEQAIKDFEEIRRLLRMLETEVGRKDGENLWTDLVFDEVRTLRALDKKVVLSGVQHHDELSLVRKHDGVCVWIDRPVKARSSLITITAKDCDLVVVNDGTVKDLYVNIVTALEQYNSDKELETTDNVG